MTAQKIKIKIQLFLVDSWINWLNFFLGLAQRVLFGELKISPRNILIYKIGNIGDIICAVPAFKATRRAFPNARITLLTSPGAKSAPGAEELLKDTNYLDEVMIYYSNDLKGFLNKTEFLRKLRKKHFDFFIQLPDDLANFRTLFRNEFFARLIGVKSAFGFKIRTVQIFKKAQVDNLFNKTETESLLGLLKENNILVREIEFDFGHSKNREEKVKKILKEKWPRLTKRNLVVAINPGGKRQGNQWPIERFAETAKYLQDKYRAKIIIIGGNSREDFLKAKTIESILDKENVLVATGKLELLETLELFKYCSFLLSNSTGTIHLAAALNLPCVGLYSTRDVPGRWFPYGKNHKILYHRFLECDYRSEECVKKSIEMISVEEAKTACDELLDKG